MESAKRASEIHKKRTGRYYRITEETVINEQMYEEEDDTPRFRLAGNMQMPNSLLQQRAQAIMSLQMESRRLLGQAVNNTLQHNPQFQTQAQFVSPGMMQMSQSGFQSSMPPPNMFHSPQTPSGFPQSPFPTPNGQNFHQRSASIAVPPQQYKQSPQTSPVEAPQFDHRRISLPHQKSSSLSPQVERRPSFHKTPPMSQNGSYPTTPTFQQHGSTSQQQDNLYYGGITQSPTTTGFDSHQSMNNSMGPLTTALPMETQQLLASGIWPNMDENTFDTMMQNQTGMKQQQQPFYNYKPNSRGSSNKHSPTSGGLDQTLLATSAETNSGAMSNGPLSATSAPATAGPVNLDNDDQGYGFRMGENTNMFHFDDNIDAYNAFSSGHNSAQQTPPPSHEEWASFLDNDMFSEVHAGAPA